MRLRSGPLWVSVPLLLASACSRTGLWQLIPETEDGGRGGSGSGGAAGGSPLPEPECEVSSDCPVVDPCAPPVCVRAADGLGACEPRPLDCDDGNRCTLDRCDPELGVCEHDAPSDADNDGHVGRAPPGVPSDCGGRDCDDTDPAVFPGASEFCNGRDDDCDDAIDEETTFAPLGEAVELAPGMERAQHGGIAWNGSAYGVSFVITSADVANRAYFGLLDRRGRRTIEPVPISRINADTFAGPVAWSGESFLLVWADARQANQYELYSTRFDALGRELSAEQRLTDASGFSLRPVLRYTGTEYLLVWDDHRYEDAGGTRAVFGRRLSAAGAPLGEEVRLTAESEQAEYAGLALNEERAVFVYVVKDGAGPDFDSVRVRTTDPGLIEIGPAVEISGDAQDASIVALRDGFLVAWSTGHQTRGWGSQIHAALLDRQGKLLQTAPVTSGDTVARTRALVSLGDRSVLVWSGAGPDYRFSLHYQLLDGLTVSSPRAVLARTSRGGDLVDPVAALGPDGDIGVLYDDNRSGIFATYFTRLSCASDTLR